MKISLILLILLIIPTTQASIYISEIMYNPSQCSDSDCEWIEIHNNGQESINLTDYTIDDKKISAIIAPDEYIIFADELSDSNNNSESFESYYGSNHTYQAFDISTSWTNEEDTIIIKDPEDNIIYETTYNKNMGANGNSHSLEYFEGLYYESLIEDGTPGYKNSVQSSLNQDFSEIEITEFFPDPKGYDNAPMPGGEWIELYNPTNEELDLLGLYFIDSANHKLYITDTSTYTTIIRPDSYLVIYKNSQALSLNNENLEEIKLYDLNSNLIDSVTYADSSEDVSWSKINNIWHKTIPSPSLENLEKNTKINESKIKIENIYLGTDKKAKFGDSLRVKFNIFKGDTGKYSIQTWIEKNGIEASKKSKFDINNKFTDYTITIPIQINPNCKQKLEDGTYKLIVKGLDEEESEEIEIEGIDTSLCEQAKNILPKEETIIPKEINQEKTIIPEINKENLNPITIFKSTEVKTKGIFIYFFIFLLILIIFLAFRKNL